MRARLMFGITLTSSALVASLLGSPAAAAPATPEFTVPGIFDAAGPSVNDFAVADFNGDAKNDIAVANINRSGVPTLLGDGTGNFGTPILTPLPSAGAATSIAAADFDGDGRMDLVTAYVSDAGPGGRILLGNGDGTFTLGQTLSGTIEQVVAGDFNADGNPDVAYSAGTIGGDTINVALGKGDGTLNTAKVYPPPFFISLYDLQAVDVNGDSKLDLVYLEGCPTVRLGSGDGTFGAEVCSTDSQARLSGVVFTTGDFNSDGKVDMAIGDASGGHVTIATGSSDGRFTFSKQYSTIAYQVISIASADFTGDGRLDLVASGDFNWQGVEQSFVLMKGKANGTFASFSRWISGGFALTPAFIDGDNLIDLVSTDLLSTGDAFVTLNVGRGTLGAPRSFTTVAWPGYVANGDLNGDGRKDVLVTAGATLAAHLNMGRGSFRTATTSYSMRSILSLGLGDLNEDGKLDAIAGSTGAKNVVVMLGNGNGSFQPGVGYGNGSSVSVLSLAVADATGDGNLDVVSHTSTALSVLPGTGTGSFGAPIVSGKAGGTQNSTMVGDVDGDGTLDAVAAIKTGTPDVASSVLYVNRGTGGGSFALIQTLNTDTNVNEGIARDLSGDGRVEVAIVGGKGSNGGRTGLYVFPNSGGTFGAATYFPVGSSGVDVADFNIDGLPDVVATCNFDGCLQTAQPMAVFVNQGAGVLAGPVNVYTPTSPVSVTAADFTGDGRPDLVGLFSTNPGLFALHTNVT